MLNVLNFRNPSFLNVCGEIKINGEEIKKYEKIAPISGYVQQDDLFFGTLTVIEHLTFQVIKQILSLFLNITFLNSIHSYSI